MSHKIFRLFICFFFFITTVNGYAQTVDEKNIYHSMETMRTAMLKADTTELEKHISPHLSYGHTNGWIEDQTAFIRDIKNGTNKYIKLEWKDMRVVIEGDVAFVRHRMISEYEGNGTPGSADIGVLAVWKKDNNGIWKLLARQAHKQPEEK